MNPPVALPRTNRAVADDRSTARLFHLLCWAQGFYYMVTGVWPLVSIETFQLVTGSKTDHLPTGSEADHWLVNTVAVLVIAIGLALLTAAKRRPSMEVVVLAAASALGLLAIDAIYVSRHVILPIYLADAAAEAILVIGWVWVGSRLCCGGPRPT
jgi:hypothetical protein